VSSQSAVPQQMPLIHWVEEKGDIYPTMFSAICAGNLPTLVPPNFCTHHPPAASFFLRKFDELSISHCEASPLVTVECGAMESGVQVDRVECMPIGMTNGDKQLTRESQQSVAGFLWKRSRSSNSSSSSSEPAR
jgi:hypothetical protein